MENQPLGLEEKDTAMLKAIFEIYLLLLLAVLCFIRGAGIGARNDRA